MKQFIIGQRWMSESEPELGLGVIVEEGSKTVTCFFPAGKVERKYGTLSSPLRRIRFSVGDEILSQSGQSLIVEGLQERDGIITYVGQTQELVETHLIDTLSFSKPEERLFSGQMDSSDVFKLRYEALLHQRKLSQSETKGFLGPRINLIPHQFYVAQQVTQRSRPRVLLADEVGLGKTIEAGLILHYLITTGRLERCLILVPDSLVYQWFVEMLKKFQLTFKTINSESKIEKGDNPFEEGQYFIASLKYLLRHEWLMQEAIEAKWDLLVVDESHQLRWSPDNSSPEYDLVAALAQSCPGLLLLSGTPEILGLAGHYARLHLLDPNRFHDFEQFLEETSHYPLISKLAKKIRDHSPLSIQDKKLLKERLGQEIEASEKCLQMLVDRHGTGRVYFRNTRKTMASYLEFFPKRVLMPYPLTPVNTKKAQTLISQIKLDWLISFVEKNKTDKTLLICHGLDEVVELEKKLKEKTTAKIAMFHSAMNLMSRDRQAAYFAEPDGASILLSTEIGSEGRNFEFAKNLILFDLPKLPDLLEQRIGRLDRIGQKNDIQIHVPYLTGSGEEVLFLWYHQGFNAFESSPRGATELYATLREELNDILQLTQDQKLEADHLKQFLIKTKLSHEQIEKKLEDGQDLLVEMNSFNFEASQTLIQDLKKMDQSDDLKSFMLNLWSILGVDVEDMNDDATFFLRPGDNMSLPHFPGLEKEGMTVTFSRENALRYNQMHFLTWDHPMVTGIMEYISSKELGNVTVSSWKKSQKQDFLWEGFFVLHAIGDRKWQMPKWFPPTPLRILMNAQGQDLTHKIPKKLLDEQTQTLSSDQRQKLGTIPKEFIKECIKRGKDFCLPRAKQYKEQFKQNMLEKFNMELQRLEALRKVNPTVSESEIILLKHNRDSILKTMDKAEIYLDSMRLIISEED